MTQAIKKVRIAFAANEAEHPRHELALERFGSLIDLNRSGDLMLVEMKNVDDGELEYIAMARWQDPETGDHRVVPFAKLFVHNDPNERYAFPDGEGGYNGLNDEEDDDAEATSSDDQKSSD